VVKDVRTGFPPAVVPIASTPADVPARLPSRLDNAHASPLRSPAVQGRPAVDPEILARVRAGLLRLDEEHELS
jgi:hypothetical protein